ncbi:MAG: low temperature requirement protein A [Saprospiraceae bacterium]
MSRIHNKNWWGAPKKFSSDFEERKISWLELFYDLVYVIAISKITHNLALNFSASGFLDYIYSFGLLFWGWYNGSMYHELHGSKGLRTYLMTFWQIIIIAAVVVTLSSSPEKMLHNVTIAIMVMQVYITYIWWSVGIYDKEHRKLNKYFTFSFLFSLALMFATFYVHQPYLRIIFYLSLIINYLPPFLIVPQFKKRGLEFNLSTSMSERLGLFAIIMFGEVVLGVIHGVSEFNELDVFIWLKFGLALFVVFAIWWLFFAMIADREIEKGMTNANLIPLIYIPTLMALGVIGVSFSKLLHEAGHIEDNNNIIFAIALAIFLLGIVSISKRTIHEQYDNITKNRSLTVISITTIFIFILSLFYSQLGILVYLLILLTILISTIITIYHKGLVSNDQN